MASAYMDYGNMAWKGSPLGPNSTYNFNPQQYGLGSPTQNNKPLFQLASPANWVPSPSYVPNPIQVTPTPAPSVTPAQTNAPQPNTNPAPAPAPAPAPKLQTAWDLWQQQATPVTSAPPPVSQVGQTVAKQGKGGSTLGNAILEGGTQYPRGMNAAAYTQDIADYQKKQNRFASTYDQMLQKLAQDSGGNASYVPGATG